MSFMADSTATLAGLIAQHLGNALAAHQAGAVAAAREQGFRNGFAEGQAVARAEMDRRLRALLLAEDDSDGRRETAAQAAGEPLPLPVVGQGPSPQVSPLPPGDGDSCGHESGGAAERGAWKTPAQAAGEPLPLPVVGQGPSPQVSPLPPGDGDSCGHESGGAAERGAWKTPARAVLLRAKWREVGPSLSEIRRAVAAMPGPALPKSESAMYFWAQQLGLGARPNGGRPRPNLAAANAARGVAAAQARAMAPPRPPKVDRRGRWPDAEVDWAAVLAWAERIDPDLVLRGDMAHRLAQVNELRVLEGLPKFRLAQVAA